MERYIEQKYLSGSTNVGDEMLPVGGQLRQQVPAESLSFVPSSASSRDPRVFRLQAFRSRSFD